MSGQLFEWVIIVVVGFSVPFGNVIEGFTPVFIGSLKATVSLKVPGPTVASTIGVTFGVTFGVTVGFNISTLNLSASLYVVCVFPARSSAPITLISISGISRLLSATV